MLLFSMFINENNARNGFFLFGKVWCHSGAKKDRFFEPSGLNKDDEVAIIKFFEIKNYFLAGNFCNLVRHICQMMKLINTSMRNFALTTLLIVCTSTGFSQIYGGEGYLVGTAAEVGLSGQWGYEGSDINL